MQQQFHQESNESYGKVFKEILSSAQELIRNEIYLAKEEIKITGARLAAHSAQTAIFGALLASSVLPFLAFAVIGLGELLGDRYWLSSLLVAVLCAGGGGFMSWRAFKKIKEQDLKLPHTRNTLEREAEVISAKIENVRNATKRRAV